MNNFANISDRFPPDAQSSEMLHPQSGREPGKSLDAAMRRSEEGMMDYLSNAVLQDQPLSGGQARIHVGALTCQMTQDKLIDRVVDLAGLMVKRLSSMPEQNARAEIIAAELQTFAVAPHSPPQPVSGCARGMGKAPTASVVRPDRGGSNILDAGAREPWREGG